jgi:uncharacterized Zn finger protein
MVMQGEQHKSNECRVEEIVTMKNGGLRAKVYGDRKRPYQVQIFLRKFSESEWERFSAITAEKAAFAAALLNDELPDSLKQRLARDNIYLFPIAASEWTIRCECSRPCKHIAAAVRALAEQAERDPSMLFELRGMPWERFFARLRSYRSAAAQSPAKSVAAPPNQADYWQMINASSAEEKDGAILSRVKDPEFWTKDTTLQSHFSPVYRKISERAAKLGWDDADGEGVNE